LADHRGKLRLICWLSSTNTDPYAVEHLMRNRPDTDVRQRNSMHAKVYLAPKTGAIVGSSNLSKAALSESENSGQHKAGVLLTEQSIVGEVEQWFEAMWSDTKYTRPITELDIAKAKVCWDKTKQSRLQTGMRTTPNGSLETYASPTPS